MTDIIWQQHNYHGTQSQNKLQSINQYGPEQPERIHFNVSDSHISTIRYPTDQQSDLLKNSFVNSSSASALKQKITSPTTFTTSDTNTINPNSQQIDSCNLLLEGRKTAVNNWSVAIDNNQNPQV